MLRMISRFDLLAQQEPGLGIPISEWVDVLYRSVLTVAALIGGGWTVYQFVRVKQAELDLQRKEIDAKGRFRVGYAFDLRVAKDDIVHRYRVVYDLVLKNIGVVTARLGECRGSVFIGKMTDPTEQASDKISVVLVNLPGNDGIVEWGAPLEFRPTEGITRRILQPEETTSIKYGFHVLTDATAYIAFDFEVDFLDEHTDDVILTRRFLQWRPLWTATENSLSGEEFVPTHLLKND